MQQAMFVMFFFIVILLLMSGLFTPVRSMPGWAQAVAAVNPLKYFIEVMRLIYLKGSGFGQLVPQFFALCGFAVAFNVWAVASYRKSS
jgi:ABC-2 type transport system permease protein